jgi:hypothetical protein
VPSTSISAQQRVATGMNVFVLPPDRQTPLFDTLHAINREIRENRFPKNVSSNFHRGIDASIVVNYTQYADRESGQYLRTRPETAPLLKRTHDLSDKHEIRWYEVSGVVTAEGSGDRLEISDAAATVAAIGIFTIEPVRQPEFLQLLLSYGETLRDLRPQGFVGLAVHRGYNAAHAAFYAQWSSVAAHRIGSTEREPAGHLDKIRALARDSLLHLYEVATVTRFDTTE